MRATLVDRGDCYELELEPESMEDMAKLVRFALNVRKEVRSVDTYAFNDDTVKAWVMLGKRARSESVVKHGC